MTVIRKYRPSDYEALRGLVLRLHENVRPYDKDLLPGIEIIEPYFRDLLRQTEETKGAIFVAEETGHLVGHVCLFGMKEPDDSDEVPDPYAFMAELYVRPDYRGRGIGDLLVKQAEEYATELGVYKMELKVLVRNEEAMQFYENHGYEPRIVIMSKRL